MDLYETGKIVSGKTVCVEWSAVRHAKNGEDYCGDLFLIKNYRDEILLAVIDGLGHGKEAYKASKKAIESLDAFANQSLISVIETCHQDLKRTRGVVMSLAVIDIWENTMTWSGVGNVEGVLCMKNQKKFQGKENIILRGGVVGYKLPLLKASVVPIAEGDTLIFTTDGIKRDFIDNIRVGNSPTEIVKYIVSNFMDESDDSLVFVARYIGMDI